MAAIHKLSSIATLPEFDLFGIPPTQACVERDIETEHRPISTLSISSCIEFNVTTAPDEYILFHESYLYLKVRVVLTKTEPGAWTKDHWDSICPTNYLLHSLFKQVEVSIGQKEITLAPQTYAYRAYLEALLGFSKDAKKSHLTSALWLDTIERDAFIKPHDLSQPEGKTIDLMGRLHLDLTFQQRALLGGCDIKIKLVPNNPKFILNTKAEFCSADN